MEASAATCTTNEQDNEEKKFVCQKSLNSGRQTELSFTPFRAVEKKYKLYKPDRSCKRSRNTNDTTDFSEVVDLHNISKNTDENKKRLTKHDDIVPPKEEKARVDSSGGGGGEKAIEVWSFNGVPGLYFMLNAVSVQRQHSWAKRALAEYTKPPYPNNLTSLGQEHPNGYCPNLRWATLGLSYDWTHKTYPPGKQSPFPPELSTLCKELLTQLVTAVPSVREGFAYEKYEPQTSIVNFFPVGTMMMAHQDISEDCLEVPLISVSVGCTSVFLMGTDQRDSAPFAFFLRSGDVAFFTGPARTAYHAVPRILDDCPGHFFSKDTGDPHENCEGKERTNMKKGEEENWRDTMNGLRINLNVRQVVRI